MLVLSLLAVLFFKMYSIRFKLNFHPAAMCLLILDIVQSIGSSSWIVLKSDLGTVVFLFFYTHTLLVRRSSSGDRDPILAGRQFVHSSGRRR